MSRACETEANRKSEASREEHFTEHAGFSHAAESLHDPYGFLDALLALQLARPGVGRREVAVPAQPILQWAKPTGGRKEELAAHRGFLQT